MTRDEAIEALNSIERGDKEKAHIKADCVILTMLRDNGFEDVARAYESAQIRVGGFW